MTQPEDDKPVGLMMAMRWKTERPELSIEVVTVRCFKCDAKSWTTKLNHDSVPTGTKPICMQCLVELMDDPENSITPTATDAVLEAVVEMIDKVSARRDN